MKLDDALRNVGMVMLDTAPVVYFVERNPKYFSVAQEIFDHLSAGVVEAVTSPVTLAECLVGPIRSGMTQARQDFIALIGFGMNVTFRDIDLDAAVTAAEFRWKYSLSTTDALQVAVALAANCNAILTNDRGFLRIKEIPILPMDDLEV